MATLGYLGFPTLGSSHPRQSHYSQQVVLTAPLEQYLTGLRQVQFLQVFSVLLSVAESCFSNLKLCNVSTLAFSHLIVTFHSLVQFSCLYLKPDCHPHPTARIFSKRLPTYKGRGSLT
jgi:hypothetical protein